MLQDQKTDIGALDSALAKAGLPDKTVVYRGIDPACEAMLSRLNPGAMVSSPSYLSATTSLTAANDFGTNLMRVELSKGTPAISMSVVSGTPGDVLLPRDLQLRFDGVGDAGEFKFSANI